MNPQFSNLHIGKLQEIIHDFIQPGPEPLYPFLKEVRIYKGWPRERRPYYLVFIVDPVGKPGDYPDKGYSEGRLGGLENDVTKEIEYTDEQLKADLKDGYRHLTDMPDDHREYYRYSDFLGKINSSPSTYLEDLETAYLEPKAARHKATSEWMAWVAHADKLDEAIDSLGEFIETDGFVRVFGGDEQGKQEAPAGKESVPVYGPVTKKNRGIVRHTMCVKLAREVKQVEKNITNPDARKEVNKRLNKEGHKHYERTQFNRIMVEAGIEFPPGKTGRPPTKK